jgi:glycerol-3-phosphate dehydrogenase (NAD(P)+)
VARITVFGAGAMGTAIAMHLARNNNETALWASPFDAQVLTALAEDRRHPALPDHLPDSLAVLGTDQLDQATRGIDIAVMGAHSGGARTLARVVMDGCGALPVVVGVAKGLEAGTGKRMSVVYAEEVGHTRVISMGGPCLAGEIARGLPTSAVLAAEDPDVAEQAAQALRSKSFHVAVTDDIAGVEYCTVAKNVAAIGMGILDGLGKVDGSSYSNAKAALFTQAIAELGQLVTALGGREETVRGLAGLGDTLVTSLGGRNRLFGELIGEGADPETAVAELATRGLTVEGWDSALDVRRLAQGTGLDLPYLSQITEILFGPAPATSVLDCLKG